MPVYAVLYYTEAKHGLCRVCKRRKSKPFTYNASVVFLKFEGNKKSPTRHTGLTTMYFTLSQRRRLRWLGHVLRMGNERIPKSMLYSELVDGTRKRGRPTLRFKGVWKCDLKAWMSSMIIGRNLMNSIKSVNKHFKEREKLFFKRPK